MSETKIYVYKKRERDSCHQTNKAGAKTLLY